MHLEMGRKPCLELGLTLRQLPGAMIPRRHDSEFLPEEECSSLSGYRFPVESVTPTDNSVNRRPMLPIPWHTFP